MKVLLTKKFFDTDLNYIRERLSDGIEILIPPDFSEDSLLALAPEADVLFGGLISENLLAASSQLQFIQVPWTGVDNLNYELLRKHEVVICNSHSNSGVVAEHAVALMMDAAKKVAYHDRLMRSGDWNRLFPGNTNKLTPFSKKIAGSKVGLVGFGAISRGIRRLLQGYDCDFKVFTRSGKPVQEENSLRFFPISDFKTEAADLDYLFICVPLTEATRGMVSTSFLKALPTHSVLINISRGAVIVENDLYEALTNGLLAFAAIDTWYQYPTPDNPNVSPSAENDFHLLDNIVLSPHRAGYVDSGFPHLDDAIENLNRAKAGKPLKNIISLDHKY